ncbi:MAG: hypothetical protein RIM84_11360 [Alphaproteobacteria bacterium]
MMLALLLLTPSGVVAAAEQPFQDCIDSLGERGGETVTCVASFELSPALRDQVARLTAGFMRDTACQVQVQVPRQMVVQALLAAGTVALPAQPVACAIATGGKAILTRFSLAPSVSFFAGEAIEASPGIADLTGLPPSVARAMQDWLNDSPLVEAALLRGINHLLESRRP